MKKKIDCLFIGHNEMNFREYESIVKNLGINSSAYKDLNKNYLSYGNTPYDAKGLYNLFTSKNKENKESYHTLEKSLKLYDSCSATIAYLGSFLNRRGFSFENINLFQEEKENLINLLTTKDILTVAITTTLYVTVFPIIEIIDFIRMYNREVKIIIGGPFISTYYRTQKSIMEGLFKSLDADVYIISSQGESALVNILESLKYNSHPLENINNIYLKNNNEYISTTLSKEHNELDKNIVNWNLFEKSVGTVVNVRTTISCPFSCAFCGFPEHAGEYYTLPVDKIAEELDQLHMLKKVRSINFIDDTFNVPVERFKKILRLIIRKKYSFKWHSYFRCQFADRETVELMKESGCEGVFLGIESGNNQILRNMNKRASVEDYLKGIQLLKENDITTFGSFIVGFPGETEETMVDTKNFIEESMMDFYRVQLWYCETITPIWKQKDTYHLKGQSFEWHHDTMNSKTACRLIDHILLSVKGPVWIPQYNFDFAMIWQLVHNHGYSLDEIKRFLISFNKGIKEKLINPMQKNISEHIAEEIRRSISKNNFKNQLNRKIHQKVHISVPEFDFS